LSKVIIGLESSIIIGLNIASTSEYKTPLYDSDNGNSGYPVACIIHKLHSIKIVACRLITENVVTAKKS
jgi:hypothetical protein